MTFMDMIRSIIFASLPRSTEDWKVGDLAVCVETRLPRMDDIDPTEGAMLRVSAICEGGLFLHFEGKPQDRHWLAAHFRKVRPDTEPAADEAWVEQLRHLRRREPA